MELLAGRRGNVIRYTYRGPLTLIGNNLCANPIQKCQITIDPTGSAAGVAMGNSINTLLPQPFVSSNVAHWTLLGNMVANTYPQYWHLRDQLNCYGFGPGARNGSGCSSWFVLQ